MKSRHSQLTQVVGFAMVAALATACGGAKAANTKGAAVGAASSAVDSAADNAGAGSAAAAPVKATGGGSFCKLYAASVNSATQNASAAAAEDTKARIEVARSDAHQALNIAPSEIKQDVALLVGVSDKMYDALAKVGYDYSKLTPADMAAFSTPGVAAAEQHLTAYIKGTCGIDLTAAAQAALGSDAPGTTPGDAAASDSSDAGGADTDSAGKACTLATVAQISAAAGKPMRSVGGAGDSICVFSAVDDASYAMDVSIYPDEASMVTMTTLETEGSDHLDGLGDDAFWNPTLGTVFVKKGTRAFSFSLPSFANLTADPAAVKSRFVTLAQQALANF